MEKLKNCKLTSLFRVLYNGVLYLFSQRGYVMRFGYFISDFVSVVGTFFGSFTNFFVGNAELKNQIKDHGLDSTYGDLETEQKEIILLQKELEADCHKYIAACADKTRDFFADKLPEAMQEVYLKKIQSEITTEFDASIQRLLQDIVEDAELYLLDSTELEKEGIATDEESVIISVYEKNIDVLQKKISSVFSQKTHACLADDANLFNLPVDEQEATTENVTPVVFFRARAIRKIPIPYDISRHNILPDDTKRLSKPVLRFGFEK